MAPKPEKKLWTEVTRTDFDHERAALHWIRERFPDREPFRAWANFTFLGADGTRNEVDLLVVSPTGVYLVEIKSYPGGRIDGDAGTWTWTRPDGSRRTFDNPIMLAERKAKKLKSLLLKQSAFKTPRMRNSSIYVKSVLFLSEAELVVGLNDAGRVDVFGPDVDESSAAPHATALPGLVRLFTRIDPGRGRRVDRPLSAAIAQAMEQAGIRESTTHRRVGDFVLGELLEEGEGWQDFAADHPVTGAPRRIRIYLMGDALDAEDRESLRRAAEREFKLLEGIRVPGIDRPHEILSNPLGPALVFERDPDAKRLDHWLDDHNDDLSQLDRIYLLREVAEAVQSAHKHGLHHRSLSPSSIWVSGEGDQRQLRIRNWHTATRSLASATTLSGTEHVAQRVSVESHVYLAPETLRTASPEPVAADIWSLGAIGFRILSGQPPAPDVATLNERLRDQGALSLASVMDAPDGWLDEVIRSATFGEATSRFVSAGEFLDFIDFALDQITKPEEIDLKDANKGDVFHAEGTSWTIRRRIGKGSTSTVFLADNPDRSEALKVARDAENAARVRDEAEVLERLRDRTIITPYGLVEIGGSTVLRLEAAEGTLGETLRTDGSLSLDLLERFGTDLLDAVVYLDKEGVAHRDIKPDNLGIAERGKDRQRRLVIFDFSLAKADKQNLRVGTNGYLDPFLEERPSGRWDEQAERYAAAVTLYEMATGSRPAWGDGSTDPLVTDLQLPDIQLDLLDASVRDRLGAFFRRALQRDPGRRFDTAGQMREEWRRVFSEAPASVAADSTFTVDDIQLDTVTESSSIAELGLPPKVRNALDRLDVVTLGDLANYPASELVRLGGIGATTRRRINELAQRLRDRVADSVMEDGLGGLSVDQLAEKLVPSTQVEDADRVAVAALLGLRDANASRWPTLAHVIAEAGITRDEIGDVLTSARGRWKRQQQLTPVRTELFEALLSRGGAVAGDELATVLLSSRGSLAQDPDRSRRARAVVRAALEAETTLERPRFVARRLGSSFLVLLDGEHEVDGEVHSWHPDELLEFAASLGEVADQIAASDHVPTSDEVSRALREVRRPEGLPLIDDARRIRLAASASSNAEMSGRLELYPYGMSPARTVAECRATLLDRRGLTIEEVRTRVRARFPKAAPLPDRPELDALMAPIGLEWGSFVRPDGEKRSGYVLPDRGGILPSTRFTSVGSTSFASPDERQAAFLAMEDRLRAFQNSGGFLALTVDRRQLSTAIRVLSERLSAPVRDLDAMILREMRSVVASKNAQWDRLLQADNERGSRGWTILGQVVDQALPPVAEALFEGGGPVIVHNLGLLARYERMEVLDGYRDRLTQTAHGTQLTGMMIVVPGGDPNALPVLDGQPVPVVGANQWAHVPSGWLSYPNSTEAA